jgi:hypothetical protein
MNVQQQNYVLSGAALINNLGYHTPFMDLPEDGIFKIRSLRFGFVLQGAEVRAEALAGGRFALVAGDRKAVIHPLCAKIGSHQGRWEVVNREGKAAVEAVIYEGETIDLPIQEMRGVEICAGVALLAGDANPPTDDPHVQSREDETTVCQWKPDGLELELSLPRVAIQYLWATGRELR